MPQRQATPLTAKQYDKLADWAERVALGLLASLVIQRIMTGTSLLSVSVMEGAVVSASAYGVAYYCLKKSR